MTTNLARAQDSQPIKVSLENATFVKSEKANTGGDPMFQLGSEHLPDVEVTFKNPDGIQYTISFPYGISEKLIQEYVKWKKIFYINEGEIESHTRDFYMFESKLAKKYEKEYTDITDIQRLAVLNELKSQLNSIPLFSQPVGMVINFVFETSRH